MKKMMFLACAIMMVAAGYAKNVNVETKPFEGVKVNVPARVRFVSGDNYEMGVRSKDSITTNSILWSIEDGVLNIRPRYENACEDLSDIYITIVAPVEPKLMVGRNFEMKDVAVKEKSDK